MICPKCDMPLSNRATSCACGWEKREETVDTRPRFSLPCAFAPGCSDPAKHRVHHEGRMLDVCDRHDIYLVTHRHLRHLQTR